MLYAISKRATRLPYRNSKPNKYCTWYSSTYENTRKESQDELDGVYWKNNMVQPVLLMQAIQAATAGEDPFNIAMEIGPHPTLKGPAVQGLQERGTQSVFYTGWSVPIWITLRPFRLNLDISGLSLVPA